jgi:hypothetical protein
MTVNGASCLLPRLPAKVSSLNAERPLSLSGGNGSSCPEAAIANMKQLGLSRVESGHSGLVRKIKILLKNSCLVAGEPLLAILLKITSNNIKWLLHKSSSGFQQYLKSLHS